MSFLRASVPNCEIPTDHAITATLLNTAKRTGTPYVINGSNVITEGILPISWVYYSHDLKHIRAVHSRFGKTRLKTFPQIGLPSFTLRILTGKLSLIHIFVPRPSLKYYYALFREGLSNYPGNLQQNNL